MTPAGNYVVGVHRNDIFETEYEQLIIINKDTGERFLLGTDVGEAIPVDLIFADSLLVSGFVAPSSDRGILADGGGVLPFSVDGNFDDVFAVQDNPIPEPSTGLLVLAGLVVIARRRRRLK